MSQIHLLAEAEAEAVVVVAAAVSLEPLRQ